MAPLAHLTKNINLLGQDIKMNIHLLGCVSNLKRHTVIIMMLLFSLSALAQKVENVRTTFDQTRQLVFIDYSITGLDFHFRKELIVTPYLVTAQGDRIPLRSASGAIGVQTSNGKNKRIVWDFAKDGLYSFAGNQITLQVNIRDAAPTRYFGLMLHGSNSSPLGAKAVSLSSNNKGYYLGFRLGHLPPNYRYKVFNSGIIDYPESGVYRIGSEKRLSSLAVTGGYIFQVHKNIYANVGLGYGREQLFWRYRAFNLDGDLISEAEEWALNDQINSNGLVGELGITARAGRVLMEAGLAFYGIQSATKNKQTFQITAGIGYVFSGISKPK